MDFVPVPIGEEEMVVVPKVVQQKRRREVPVEQVVDVPVPQLHEDLVVTPVIVQKERLVHRHVQKVVDVPVHQVVVEEVPVPKIIEQEEVVFRPVEQIIPVQRPQVVEKIVEVPKVQVEEKIIQVPMIQRNWVDTVKHHHVQVVETERPKTLQKVVKRRKPILQEKIIQVPKIVQEAVPVKKVVQRSVEVPTVEFEDRTAPALSGLSLEIMLTDELYLLQMVRRKYLTPFVVGLLVECAGKENIFTSGPELEKHSADHSHHLPCLPEAVIYPRSTEMVSEVMKICHRTGLEGGCIPLGGVSLDLSKMNQVLKLHREELQVHVQAGIKKEMLKNDYLEPQGLFFQVDPASNPSLGGMAACGSSGTLCCNYGTMKENVVSLTVVLADGTVISTRRGVRKNSTGYDLTHLCMGQELVSDRTLYCGNLGGEASVADVREAFQQRFRLLPAFQEKYLKHGVSHVVVQVNMGKGRGNFAFITFFDPQLASTALLFNGMSLCGRRLVITWPMDYTPPHDGALPGLDVAPLRRLGMLPQAPRDRRPDRPDRGPDLGKAARATSKARPKPKSLRHIFIGNMPEGQDSMQEVSELVTCFCSELPSFRQELGPAMLGAAPRGGGWLVEMQSPELAMEAARCLREVILSGRTLSVYLTFGRDLDISSAGG
ncbi:unnamed protein product [Effrenium voratum]|nr:unnamed protein product [Effrenium voratum]